MAKARLRGLEAIPGGVLDHSGCHSKIPYTRWLKQQTFISHSSGGWKSKMTALAGLVSGESPLPGSGGGRGDGAPGVPFITTQIPFMRAPPS